MKHLLLIFLVAFSLLHHAQESVFTLKPALGLNGCQVHGDSYSGYDKLGIFAGAAVNARFSERTSLELGFYFSQKGSRHNPNPKTGNLSFYRLHLNYIDLPLSLRFMLNSKYFLTGGPSVAYLVSYSENIDYIDFTGRYKFNRYEIGLNIGLGRNINERFSVEVRSSNSINTIRTYGIASNVFYPNPVARYFNKGFYNNILTVIVAYHLGAKKNAE